MTWLTDTILRLAGPLVLVAVFALPALEASTLLGVVVPGELALVLGGLLAHQGRVPLWAAVVAGAAGAVVGVSVGYAIGGVLVTVTEIGRASCRERVCELV